VRVNGLRVGKKTTLREWGGSNSIVLSIYSENKEGERETKEGADRIHDAPGRKLKKKKGS